MKHATVLDHSKLIKLYNASTYHYVCQNSNKQPNDNNVQQMQTKHCINVQIAFCLITYYCVQVDDFAQSMRFRCAFQKH